MSGRVQVGLGVLTTNPCSPSGLLSIRYAYRRSKQTKVLIHSYRRLSISYQNQHIVVHRDDNLLLGKKDQKLSICTGGKSWSSS